MGFMNIYSKMIGIQWDCPGQTRKQMYPNSCTSGLWPIVSTDLFQVKLLPWSICVLLLSDRCLYAFLAYMQGNKVPMLLRILEIMSLFLYFNPLMGTFRLKRRKPATWGGIFCSRQGFWVAFKSPCLGSI